MSSSISSTASALAPVHGHHRHHALQADAPGAKPAAAASSPASASPAAASSATPADGLQAFASELQSILLNAQSGQQTAPGSNAGNAHGATDPTAAAGQAGPIRRLADRLQDLLGGSAAHADAAGAAGSQDSLDTVLNTLQQTLQHTLAAYAKPASSQSTTSLSA